MRQIMAWCAARFCIVLLYLLLPLMPLLASAFFMRWRYLRHYGLSLRRAHIHLTGLRQGPLQHYFSDVVGRTPQIPDEIRGSCVQCGNCCMERQCFFLEPTSDDKYQCGIYHSFWRRFSNCGSFPLSQYDIDRYACPSYYAVPKHATDALPVPEQGLQPVPIQFVRNPRQLRASK